MLKFQSKDGSKNVWLVGPTMRIGSSRENEIPVSGDAVGALHGYLHIQGDDVAFEPISGQASYINENPVTAKQTLTKDDVLRIGSFEFEVIDPQEEKARKLKQANADKTQQEQDSEATVFRQVASVMPEASGWMIQGLHPSLKNKRFPIDGTMTLGRAAECELNFAYERLSRKHAQFKLLDGVLFVKDLDSSNGLFHNGEKVSQAKLSNGDSIAFDKLEFTVIAPKEGGASSEISGGDNANETVVRSAITPEMMQQAQLQAKAAKPQVEPVVTSLDDSGKTNTLVIGVVGILVVAVAAAAFFIL